MLLIQMDGILIGRMSFRLFNGEIDGSTFSLLANAEDSPRTGIKISQTMETEYTNTAEPSVFRFTVLNSDATLSGIKYDFFNYEKDSGENLTLPDLDYKDIDLDNPDASSTEDTSIYKIEVRDYLENISLQFAKTDTNSKVEIDGTEIDVSNSKELVLNALGEEDTQIDIVVTAQDGSTTHTYRILIHRPCATIRGSIIYDTIEEDLYDPDSGDCLPDKTTNFNFYNSGEPDWQAIVDSAGDTDAGMDAYADVDSITKQYEAKSEDDGTYEIHVIPGKYDLQIDRGGFLDYIITHMDLSDGDDIDLGEITLVAGDVNRDGYIGLEDLGELLEHWDETPAEPEFDRKYDLVQYDAVGLETLGYAVKNTDELITVINFNSL